MAASSIPIHTLHSREDTEAALHEIIRVLNMTEYVGCLAKEDIQTVGLHYRMFPPIRILIGRKS
jgi:hypothetical protein